MKYYGIVLLPNRSKSPPARGAWIEIPTALFLQALLVSRPPHGGRGLKYTGYTPVKIDDKSPPARGAWIEIGEKDDERTDIQGRPPHGGRGLKS